MELRPIFGEETHVGFCANTANIVSKKVSAWNGRRKLIYKECGTTSNQSNHRESYNIKDEIMMLMMIIV